MDITTYLLVMLIWLTLDASIALARAAAGPGLGDGATALRAAQGVLRLLLALYTLAILGGGRLPGAWS